MIFKWATSTQRIRLHWQKTKWIVAYFGNKFLLVRVGSARNFNLLLTNGVFIFIRYKLFNTHVLGHEKFLI
jgi:hypothetical protein